MLKLPRDLQHAQLSISQVVNPSPRSSSNRQGSALQGVRSLTGPILQPSVSMTTRCRARPCSHRVNNAVVPPTPERTPKGHSSRPYGGLSAVQQNSNDGFGKKINAVQSPHPCAKGSCTTLVRTCLTGRLAAGLRSAGPAILATLSRRWWSVGWRWSSFVRPTKARFRDLLATLTRQVV